MSELQTVIEKIQDMAGEVFGIRIHPDYMPDAVNVFPALFCYASSGSYEYAPAGVMKGLHNIVLELHVAQDSLPKDLKAVMGFAESIPLAIMADPTLDGTVSTIGRISYSFGGMQYGDKKTLGFRWTLESVKLQTVI